MTIVISRPVYADTFFDLKVYVGYADNLRPSPTAFPNPWDGSPNVTFLGAGATADNHFDAGAVRIDNIGSFAILVDSVTVDLPGNSTDCGPAGCRPHSFDLWPHSFSIPAKSSVILTQTGPFENFDTSDFQIEPCGTNATAGFKDPLVSITIGGTIQQYDDSGHVIDTHGYDLANCPPGTNESTPWTQIGTVPSPYDVALFESGLPSDGVVECNQNITAIATSTDASIDHVRFVWKDSSGASVRDVTITGNQDAFAPGTGRNWVVEAHFLTGEVEKSVVIKHFSVNCGPVGGEILGTDVSSLFVAGAAANLAWILPTIAGVAGALILTAIGIRKSRTFD